jgi:hypothetical protein
MQVIFVLKGEDNEIFEKDFRTHLSFSLSSGPNSRRRSERSKLSSTASQPEEAVHGG